MKIELETKTCPNCGHYTYVEVDEIDYQNWKDGTPSAFAFPYLSSDQREQLITGLHGACLSSWLK